MRSTSTSWRRRGRPAVALALAVASVAGAACSYQSRAVLPVVPEEVESSTVYAADGTLLHTFHAEENRKVVPLDEIPRHVQDAVIAIEDERFYRHRGVDLRAILRAMRANALAGDIEEGGSTITQQYVKKVLLQDESQTLSRKIEEASMALQLEERYSKERILELYLNAVYFGNGAYGVEAAARQYFGKPIGEVTLAEAALIAGLIQRPSATDPYRAPEAAVDRRDVVLEAMRDNRFADDAAIDAALAEPITLGSSTTPAAERYAGAYFLEEVKQWVLDDPRFGETPQERRDLLFGGGLRIQTTLDLSAQAKAEAAVAEVLPDPAGPAASLVAIDPTTGYVKAMVGGRDFFGDSPIAKLNLATQGPRQAGSAFKPLVLAAALEQDIDPERVMPAPACTSIDLGQGQVWRPCNYGGGGGGNVTIVEGTVRSYNTLYAHLMMDVGPDVAMEAAARYGIRSPLEPVPSAVLGSNVVTALDMAAAYATFANRGIKVPPILVTRITRADGTILFQHRHTQERVLDTDVADVLTSILRQVIERGTGTRAQIGRPAAGKTGTTDDWKDAWFAGYTPQLATAVWVGFPQLGADGQLIRMQPPATPIRVTGGSYPAQIWQRFMASAHDGVEPVDFPPPPTTTTTVGAVPSTTTTVGPPTPVPDVEGREVEAAVAALREAGFVVERIAAIDEAAPPGTVVAQSPPGGSTAAQGSTVRIEVAGDPSG
ncbi:MAG: penicillin-binding protein [Acidimicrobiia bacterium]|jgi:penicillin-binding protein 1A